MPDKPRFILVDQALKSLVGHYYEYDASILAVLPPAYDALVFSNIDAVKELQALSTPFFQCDFWAPSMKQRAISVQAFPPSALQGKPAPKSEDTRDRQPDQGRMSSLLEAYRHLKQFGKRLDRRIGQRWWGRRSMLLVKRLYWRTQAWRWRRSADSSKALVSAPQPEVPLGVSLNETDSALRSIFLSDLLQLLEQYAIGSQDVLFFPNMNQSALAAIVDLVHQKRSDQLPYFKLLFRRNIFVGQPTYAQYVSDNYYIRVFDSLFSQMSSYLECAKIKFYTDTERLKNEYEVFSPFRFTVLPIPFRHDFIRYKDQRSRPYRVVYLGSARVEKGFHHLPPLVEAMRSRIEAGQVEFVFQSFPDPEPETLEAIQKLQNQIGVRLLAEPLTDQQYYELLNSSDVLLLLYDSLSYFSRSSCVFIESIVSATPFITFAGSWMADIMVPGTGEVVETVADLPRALERILDNYAAYHHAIRQVSDDWRKHHNPKRLMEVLL